MEGARGGGEGGSEEHARSYRAAKLNFVQCACTANELEGRLRVEIIG